MDITQLSDLLIKASKRSMRDFCSSMCPLPLEEGLSFKELPTDISRDNYEIVGIIAISGQINGSVSLYTKSALASSIAQTMLKKNNITPGEISDVVGEVTNIITGSIKTWVSVNEGINFDISCPSVISGNPYLAVSIQPSSSFIGQKFKINNQDLLAVVSIHL